MVSTATEYLDGVVAHFTAAFEQVITVERDEKPGRSLLEMIGTYGPYRVRLSEIIITGQGRKYAYYVLRGNRVVAGFDNAADSLALKIKYGPDYKKHSLERVPHCHTEDKTKLALTEEMDCLQFISWLKANLPL